MKNTITLSQFESIAQKAIDEKQITDLEKFLVCFTKWKHRDDFEFYVCFYTKKLDENEKEISVSGSSDISPEEAIQNAITCFNERINPSLKKIAFTGELIAK